MNLFDFLKNRKAHRAQKLYDEGRELLEVMDYDGVLAIGGKLRRLHHTSAFEIEGLAYSGLRQSEDAVRVLREGLELAPGAWPNWHLLGSCLSDLGRYTEAGAAYDRAEACPGSDRSGINLNRAILASRREDYESALRYLDDVAVDDSLRTLCVIAQRVGALHALGRDDEASDLGSRTVNEWRDASHGKRSQYIGKIQVVLGEIGLARGEDPAVLRAAAIDSWRVTGHVPLLWLIREIQQVRSPALRHFRLQLHGRIAEEIASDIDARGFYRSANVVADSPEDAFALVLELDPPDLGVMLAIDEVEILELQPDVPRGVYTISGCVYYRESP